MADETKLSVADSTGSIPHTDDTDSNDNSLDTQLSFATGEHCCAISYSEPKAAMTIADSTRIPSPARLEGKYSGMVVCWILGLGSLVSWNSMLTIGDYYYELFPKYHPSRVLTIIYQPFALATIAILAHNEAKIDTRKRNLTGYTMFFSTTLALLVLDLATSGKGGLGSYIGICALVAAFGVADALVKGGMVGDLSFMCPEFIQSFLAGLGASGALTAALRLITKAAFERATNGLRKGLPIVKYYRTKAAKEGSETVAADLAAAGIQKETADSDDNNAKQLERLSNKKLIFQNIDCMLDMYLIYVLTFSIFPGFLYENTGSHNLGSCVPPLKLHALNLK
ncbi:equilibrative nucleotide transporter 3-like [Lycium ferocissimum]|uniref:equilibrative nucleotide transporter 3-like n=1 Tax=Lycium ferocissimum TaxID=112874 RepID=UPI002814DB8D|nr:equilibrative nucleotide transporter 3-like [Lycium ferocissimum]